jgi:hypothetical protein
VRRYGTCIIDHTTCSEPAQSGRGGSTAAGSLQTDEKQNKKAFRLLVRSGMFRKNPDEGDVLK